MDIAKPLTNTFQDELRRIKRRRIEIRGQQAALDMEDLDLDDRQSELEKQLMLLRSDRRADSASLSNVTVENRRSDGDRIVVTIDDDDDGDQELMQTSERQQSTLLTSPQLHYSFITLKNEQDREASTGIKVEDEEDDFICPTVLTPDPVNAFNIAEEDGENDNVIQSKRKPKSTSSSADSIKRHSSSQAERHIESVLPSRTDIDTIVLRPRKIVTLKVRFDPKRRYGSGTEVSTGSNFTKSTSLSASSIQSGSTSRSKATARKSAASRLYKQTLLSLEQYPISISSIDPPRSSRTKSLSPVSLRRRRLLDFYHSMQESTSQDDHTSVTDPSFAQETGLHIDEENDEGRAELEFLCACQGRNRNCWTCRGTPAVIAEGRQRERRQLLESSRSEINSLEQTMSVSTMTASQSQDAMSSSMGCTRGTESIVKSETRKGRAISRPKTYCVELVEDEFID